MTRRLLVLITAVAVALAAPAASAAPSASRPASLLVYPLITVDEDGSDTLVRLTNLGSSAQAVRCIYLDGSLTPGQASDFLLTLTPNQPIAWYASQGLETLPITAPLSGPDGSRNSGSVPPIPVVPFSGVLRCLTTDSSGVPVAADTLTGNATLTRAAPLPDSASYAAVGFSGTGASTDAPEVLVLGGDMAEYDACPESLTLQPLLDGAVVELGPAPALQRRTQSTLVVVTCSSAPASGAESATIDMELTNELGETFTARRPVREHLVSELSRLDSTVPANSIFNSAMAGSPTGNLRIVPEGSGVLALLLTSYVDPADAENAHRVAVAPQMSGERALPDLVDLTLPDAPTPTPTVPPAACTGDCNGSGDVAINELIVGVNIALGNSAVSTCPPFDANDSGDVTINELIAAVNNALNGCQ